MSSFNPKQKLQQIRKRKLQQQSINFQNSPPPLFSQQTNIDTSNDVMLRLAKLENQISQLSSQLKLSKNLVNNLSQDKSNLQLKILKLQHENSQLKSNKLEYKQQNNTISNKQSVSDVQYKRYSQEKQKYVTQQSFQNLMPQVEEVLQQIKKQPLQNILKRKQQNFRALKADIRQISTGNKLLKQFSSICKDYGKTMKKPILLLNLMAQDFD